MSKLSRNADPGQVVAHARTFFITTKCAGGMHLLQTERNANLLADVLRQNVRAGRFQVHDFVIMPDHLHLLISVPRDITIERAVQHIKGGFSYRLHKELGYRGEVWQRGFGDVRVLDVESFENHRRYIAQNPVRRGLVHSVEQYPFTFKAMARQKAAGAKAHSEAQKSGTTEVVPLHESRPQRCA